MLYVKEVGVDSADVDISALRRGQPYQLNIELERPEFGNENLSAVYFNYFLDRYYATGDESYFDPAAWKLKAFAVDITLHNELTGETSVQKMSYDPTTPSWAGVVQFELPVPTENYSVEYYNDANGDPLAPHLLAYDVYLSQDTTTGNLVLKLPNIEVAAWATPDGRILNYTVELNSVPLEYSVTVHNKKPYTPPTTTTQPTSSTTEPTVSTTLPSTSTEVTTPTLSTKPTETTSTPKAPPSKTGEKRAPYSLLVLVLSLMAGLTLIIRRKIRELDNKI